MGVTFANFHSSGTSPGFSDLLYSSAKKTDILSAIGWWRGIVCNAFWMKRSYSTLGPVSTAMGDCLRAGKPPRCEACQLGQLSLLPSEGW